MVVDRDHRDGHATALLMLPMPLSLSLPLYVPIVWSNPLHWERVGVNFHHHRR